MSRRNASEVDIYAGARLVPVRPFPAVVAKIHGTGGHRFLYIHGNPASMLDFEPLARQLTGLGEVCAFDLPGFGSSPDLPKGETLSLDLAAEVVMSVLDHLGWEDAVLVGHSHGGGVAQRVAGRFPRRVRALVLLGTLGVAVHFNYRALSFPGVALVTTLAGRAFPLLPIGARAVLVRFFMRNLFAPHHATASDIDTEVTMLSERPHILKNMAKVAQGAPWNLLLRDAHLIKTKTLVLHGTLDPVVPIRYGRGVHDAIVDSRLVELEGVGHMLTLHATDLVASEIGRFLFNFNKESALADGASPESGPRLDPG